MQDAMCSVTNRTTDCEGYSHMLTIYQQFLFFLNCPDYVKFYCIIKYVLSHPFYVNED